MSDWRVGVGVVVMDGDNILLLQRAPGMDKPGTWGLPGGKMDPEDTSWADTASRELREETGLIANGFQQLGWVDYVGDNGQTWITLFVKALSWNGTATNVEPDKCSGMQWITMPRAIQELSLFGPLKAFMPTHRSMFIQDPS